MGWSNMLDSVSDMLDQPQRLSPTQLTIHHIGSGYVERQMGMGGPARQRAMVRRWPPCLPLPFSTAARRAPSSRTKQASSRGRTHQLVWSAGGGDVIQVIVVRNTLLPRSVLCAATRAVPCVCSTVRTIEHERKRRGRATKPKSIDDRCRISPR